MPCWPVKPVLAHGPPDHPCVILSSLHTVHLLRGHLPARVARPAPRVLYSYAHSATGFAARLTGAQAAHLASQDSVLAVVPDATHQLHTTLTPSFLGASASRSRAVCSRRPAAPRTS